MKTTHRLFFRDSRDLGGIGDDTVDLILTSPPYPMIGMWDELFCGLDPSIRGRMADSDFDGAFLAMHQALSGTWDECVRVLKAGGIACINVGDATRTLGGRFRLWPNHAVVSRFLTVERGLTPLPSILWRKSTNKPTKFMGSGMLPPNAYVTLEHEYILVFRKGDRRVFEADFPRRYESAYFFEERNAWFSDVWFDLGGVAQAMGNGRDELRERSGAFPLELACRLIHMFSIYGDTVLDPFWGTGTTSTAAMFLGRNSIGVELDRELGAVFEGTLDGIPGLSRKYNEERLRRHRSFMDGRGNRAEHRNEHYGVPVVTAQERGIRLYDVETVRKKGEGVYEVVHRLMEK